MAEKGHVKKGVNFFLTKTAQSCSRINFLLIGQAGVGKTTLLANLIENENVEGSGKIQSQSDLKIKKWCGEIKGIQVVVYDTPGLSDSRGDYDADYLAKIKAIIDGNDIHLVIYCLRMIETRMHEGILRTFKQFDEIGVDWKRTIFALTFADAVKPSSRVRNVDGFDMQKYFNDRLQHWKEEIPEFLISTIGDTTRSGKACLRKIRINPSSDDPDHTLPNGEKWFTPFWMDVVKTLPPGPMARFLDIYNGHSERIVLRGERRKMFEHDVGSILEKAFHDLQLEEEIISQGFPSSDSIGQTIVEKLVKL